MGIIKIAALLLIIAGVSGLVYGGFNYPKDSQSTKVGPVELVVTDTGRVNIPIWAGIGAIAVGSMLLLLGGGIKSGN
jgi:hypothetical protein